VIASISIALARVANEIHSVYEIYVHEPIQIEETAVSGERDWEKVDHKYVKRKRCDATLLFTSSVYNCLDPG
jgi:hypothetical protein